MKNIIKYINSRFNAYYTRIDEKTDKEFTSVLKDKLGEYFSTPQIDVRIENVTTEIEMMRYIRENLIIQIDTEEIYIPYPSILTLKKELRGYTLIVKIRGLDIEKMSKIMQRAHRLVEEQDDINYPLG